jgi:hypothetical protein
MNDDRRFSLVQADNLSRDAARAEERRLCAIVESDTATTDEKYQALVDLALLTGVFVRNLADAA